MIEARLIYEKENFLNDVQDIPRAFSPYLIISDDAEHYIKWKYTVQNDVIILSVSSDIFPNKEYKSDLIYADYSEYKRIVKRFIKNSLYDFLSKELQIRLPYGSLTGVRPTKLYYELGAKSEQSVEYLVEKFDVSPQKAVLIADCVKNQKNYINRDENAIGIFVNIPFCPSRCKYCSFISTELFRVKKQIDFYVECVKKELAVSLDIAKRKGYEIRSVYVGGGTPTSIGGERLRDMLSALKGVGKEFTVEAGRPDAIDDSVVSALRSLGVTRVSVNPQTFCDQTLAVIGRKHTVADFYASYETMKAAGFDINTDLIAGLPGENSSVFIDSVHKCLELKPDNVTIHTFSLKRGATFVSDGMGKAEFGSIKDAVEESHELLRSAGYVPYYMYRQKNTADNLENTGFCIDGKQCIYNVDMMEEAATIIGSGAGSMTKFVCGNKIERLSSPKGFREYIERIDDVCARKKEFFGL